MHPLIQEFEKRHIEELMSGKDFPPMRIGDTVRVLYRIKEGEKYRNQPFQGTLIRRRGSGKSVSDTFTLRKVVANEGVERTFPLYSPNLVSVEIVRYGKARRAKLYYLRERVGKATKIKERQVPIEKVEKKPKRKKRKKSEEKKGKKERKAAKKSKKAKRGKKQDVKA